MNSKESLNSNSLGQKDATTPRPQLSLGIWLVLLCWPIVVATLALLWNQHQTERAVAAAAAELPKVAVVDELDLLQMVIDSGVDQTNPRAMLAGIDSMIQSSGLGDTIVVSKSMVMYAPEKAQIVIRNPKPSATLEVGP